MFKTAKTKAEAETKVDLPSIELTRFDKTRPYPYLQKFDEEDLLYWGIAQGNSVNILKARADSEIAYIGKYYSVNDAEIGVSQYFYVKLREEANLELLKRTAKKTNVKLLGNSPYRPLWFTLACTYESMGDAVEMANYFYETRLFEATQPDFINAIHYSSDKEDNPVTDCTNDPDFSDQWNLHNTNYSDIDISFCGASQITSGDSKVRIVVIDKGMENHEDLSTILDYWDIEDNVRSLVTYGEHGMQVGGIIGATNNSTGIAGIAPGCEIMPISTDSKSHSEDPLQSQDYADAIARAWDHEGAEVINCSWYADVELTDLTNAINQALASGRNGLGSIVVFSSGKNDGASSISYPQNSNSDILVVGALKKTGYKLSTSRYGDELDVVAPGENIPTLLRDNDYDPAFGESSAAAPHASAIAGLVLSVNPTLSHSQVHDVITSTAKEVRSATYSYPWNNKTGHGLVDAHSAVLDKQVVISGPDAICSWTSNSNYTLTNVMTGSVTWSVSCYSDCDPSMPVSNSSGSGTSFSTKASSSSATGTILITATINLNGEDWDYTKKVRVGSPKTQYISTAVFQGQYGDHELCAQTSSQLIAANYNGDATAEVISFDWDFYDNPSMVNGFVDNVTSPGYENQGTDVNTYDYYGGEDVYFKLRADNAACGWSNWLYQTYSVISCGGYLLSMSPNPADEEVSVTLQSSLQKDNSQDALRSGLPAVEIKIFDSNQSLVLASKKMDSSGVVTFDTSSLLKGSYIVHVIVNGITEKKHLIIE